MPRRPPSLVRSASGRLLPESRACGANLPALDGSIETPDHKGRTADEANDEETEEKRNAGRRLEERAVCDIEAKVEPSDRLAIACRVRDLTTNGLKLQIAATLHLRDEFDVLLPVIEGTFQRYRVRTIWRKDDVIGGEFLTPHAH